METIKKPWGKEELLEINNKYAVKRLTMFKNCRCSLQYHELKTETIYVLEGLLRIYYGKDKNNMTFKDLKSNEYVTIFPFEVHRMEGITNSIYLESSTIEIDDVIRLEDDYKRM